MRYLRLLIVVLRQCVREAPRLPRRHLDLLVREVGICAAVQPDEPRLSWFFFLGVNLTLPHPVVGVGCVPIGSANRPWSAQIPRDHVGMSHPGAESTASGGQKV